jgi:hypothetical protein
MSLQTYGLIFYKWQKALLLKTFCNLMSGVSILTQYINPLGTKVYLSQLETQSVPRSKHSLPRLQKPIRFAVWRNNRCLFWDPCKKKYTVSRTQNFWMLKLVVHSAQQKSSGLIFCTSRSGSDVTYSRHHNSRRFTFPILVPSWHFSVYHSLQSITLRTY